MSTIIINNTIRVGRAMLVCSQNPSEVESLPKRLEAAQSVVHSDIMGVLFICVEVPLLCHWQLLTSLHRPLYSFPLECLKAALRESEQGSNWGCNDSPGSWALLAEGQRSEPPGQDRRLTS